LLRENCSQWCVGNGPKMAGIGDPEAVAKADGILQADQDRSGKIEEFSHDDSILMTERAAHNPRGDANLLTPKSRKSRTSLSPGDAKQILATAASGDEKEIPIQLDD